VEELVNIRLEEAGDALVIIDQSLLPNQIRRLTLRGKEEMFEAIASLRVRGAPAIGIFAGYALYVLARGIKKDKTAEFFADLRGIKTYLDSSRPTAVNLRVMLNRVEAAAIAAGERGEGIAGALESMRREAESIHGEDMAMCRAISEYGLTLIKDGDGVLTHCNAGPLATSRYGTGLGPILLARERGINLRVFCDETRPLLQGARLTAFELYNAGVDTTLICDNMAGIVMSEGKINACFVGCDAVAMNGDTANKIGTSVVAVLARYYGIPFYVCCPSSTIDTSCRTGAGITIEMRAPEEIKEKYFTAPTAPAGVKCYNPAFDVTPNELVTAIITEKGICRAPYVESLGNAARRT
jgi:methylthioribose-1-phosphate isomerase